MYHAVLQVDAITSSLRKCEELAKSYNELGRRLDAVENKDINLERKQKELSARMESEEMKTQSKLERLVKLL